LLITGIVLTGCSSSGSGSTVYSPVEDSQEDSTLNQEEVEKEFIKTAVESSQKFETEISTLKSLLSNIDVKDSGWECRRSFCYR
jgi:hypothetical protein